MSIIAKQTNIKIGTKVVRGKDWSYGAQDYHEGKPSVGRVISREGCYPENPNSSWVNVEWANGINAIQGLCFEEILVLCRIPKGSRYFLGDGGEIVSDKLELLEILYTFLDSTYCELIKRIQFISESVDDAKPYLKTLKELKKFKKVSDEQDEFVVPYITKMLASYNIKIGV